MKLAGKLGKSSILILAIATIAWFFGDLSSVPASGSLLEKLMLSTPVVLAIRVSLIFVALGIIGLIISIFWKQIGIIKIGSSGIEFGKMEEIPDKTNEEISAIKAKIRDLKAENALLIKERTEFKKQIKALESRTKGAENE
jgi:hypothetical protein